MNKLLITSGCSFSECFSTAVDTWPRHLARALPEYKHQSYAMGSQGNGLISRGIIYGVSEALKTHKPEDILVGIMWSGTDRHDFRCTDPSQLQFVIDKAFNGWIENPTGFIKDIPKQWVILNHGWSDPTTNHKNKEAEYYYRYFHDRIGGVISTLEHMLRVQWFLQQNKMKYFFTTYTDYVLEHSIIESIETKHLYDMLDFDHFLPVTSEYTWCVENTKYSHLWNDLNRTWWEHPKTAMHLEFVDQVIMPWLTEKKYL